MWPRAEGTGTISRNETGGCGSKLCYFSVLALEEGRCVHQEVIQSGLELDVFVGSSLVDMYAMCGSMGNACRVFNKMPFRIVVTWSTILGGCGMHGHGKEALNILNRCVKKVYSQMISLLFVFCQLVAMQVLSMKACGFMLQWSQTI